MIDKPLLVSSRNHRDEQAVPSCVVELGWRGERGASVGAHRRGLSRPGLGKTAGTSDICAMA